MSKPSDITPDTHSPNYYLPVSIADLGRVEQKDMNFGEMLRKERQARLVTLGEMSRHLGVSVAFLSDVELGRRPPFLHEQIMTVANILKLDHATAALLIRSAQRRKQ